MLTVGYMLVYIYWTFGMYITCINIFWLLYLMLCSCRSCVEAVVIVVSGKSTMGNTSAPTSENTSSPETNFTKSSGSVTHFLMNSEVLVFLETNGIMCLGFKVRFKYCSIVKLNFFAVFYMVIRLYWPSESSSEIFVHI